MKSNALLALIVVGAATTASAQPKSEESTARVSLNEKDASTSRTSYAPGEWVEIATPTPTKHGQEFISIGREAGAFRKLRIDAANGKVVVLRVKVRFTDGTTKVYPIDKRLDAKRQKSHLIDLKNDRTIDQIVVKTETYTKGAYSIYGSSSGGVVAGR